MEETVSLAELGVDEDPGTAWHPRPDKAEARDLDGLLRDLDDDEVSEHTAKPEALEQVDSVARLSGEVLAAEDSAESPDGAV